MGRDYQRLCAYRDDREKDRFGRTLHFDISVDSPDPAANDYIRGAPGSLLEIEQGIERLRNERKRAGQTFSIRIKPTVSRLNFRQLRPLTDRAVRHGADTIDFHPVHSLPFWTDEMRAELWPSDPEIAEMREVIEDLIDFQAKGAPIETAASSLRTFPDQFSGLKVQTALEGSCRVGLRDFMVKANGDVSVCWDFPAIGNVKTTSAREIWKGALARTVRQETTSCSRAGRECANSCLDHRSLSQEIKRGLLLLART